MGVGGDAWGKAKVTIVSPQDAASSGWEKKAAAAMGGC